MEKPDNNLDALTWKQTASAISFLLFAFGLLNFVFNWVEINVWWFITPFLVEFLAILLANIITKATENAILKAYVIIQLHERTQVSGETLTPSFDVEELMKHKGISK